MKLKLLIPAATWPVPHEAAAVQAGLALPALAWLLGRADRQSAPALDFSAPFACATARAPLLLADLAPASEAGYWLCADPVSLRLDHNKVTLLDRRHFAISAAEAADLVAALNRQFAGDGLWFCAVTPDHWFVKVADCPEVRFTPLAEVAGRNIAEYLPQGPDAARWHGLLNEIQMLLYTHPVNDARAARGEPLINGAWLCEGGALPLAQKPKSDLPVWSDNAWVQSLGRLAQVPTRPLPRDAAGLDGDALLVLDQLQGPLQDGDAYHWRETWLALERNWFAPLLALYRAGRISQLELCFSDVSARLPAGRGWQFWRRPCLPWRLSR